MAGNTEDFTAADAAEFRDAIHVAMKLGTPNDPAAVPTFYWDDEKTYPSASADGQPWVFGAAPETDIKRGPVQAPCAVELLDAAGNVIETPIGDFDADSARLTFLDVDWAKVVIDGKPFDYVTLGGNEYRWGKKLPNFGLGSADVIQVVVNARDES